MRAIATRDDTATPAAGRPEGASGGYAPAWLIAAAGPALIVASVAFAMRGFAFLPRLTNQHPDILTFVLPRMSFLGRSLAAGHVPLWNPFEMTGTPFAADPQSGWLYAPPMLLFSVLSPGSAMRAFIVFNPLLAGLGMYAFLRLERLSRPSATAGGLSIAMVIATSSIAVSMPFAGSIAWTTVVLVGAAGYVGADRMSRRVAWLALAAFAWGQVASAHMSHGLGICTLLVAAYLVAHAVRDAGVEHRSGYRAAVPVLAFLAVLPLANLAIFVPRLDLLARSSLQLGYGAFADPLSRGEEPALMSNGVWSGWPLALGSSPGAYMGATILLAVPLALRTRRHRTLLAAFGAAAALAYALTLNALVTAEWFRSFVLRLPYGDVYLHNPGRLRYLVYIAAPVVGAIGIQALIDRPPERRRLGAWLAGGAALCLGLPLLLGAYPRRFALLAAGIVLAIAALVALGKGRRWAAAAIPLVLACELLASAVFSSAYQGGTIHTGLEGFPHPNLVPGPLRWPDVSERDFLDPGPIARFLRARDERYLTWVLPAASYVKGYLWTRGERDWPAMANERGTLFGARDALGYNPVQLPGYWSYIRATNRLFTFYNASVINLPTIEDLRLLGVRYLLVNRAQGLPPGLSGRPLVREGDVDLYEVDGWQPRASVVLERRVVPGMTDALQEIVAPGFDPARTAVVEGDSDPTPTSPDAEATATYRETSPEDARIVVAAPSDAVAVVRNNWDEGWRATVDGEVAPVLRADAFRQAVPVPAGRHEIRLVYDDPAIGRGLALSALVWFAIAVAGAISARTERAARRRNSAAG
jgi:hypothetical protein